MMKCQFIIALSAALLIASCASTSDPQDDDLGDAVMAPAEDLNIVKDDIPPVLLALEAVYAAVSEGDCEAIEAELLSLDGVLGPDDDAPDEEDPSATEKVAKGTADLTTDAVEGATTSFIPFRGAVRFVTGAQRHQRKVEAAYRKGQLRRSYLKGLGEAYGCEWPARPYLVPENDKVGSEQRNPA